MSLPWAGLLAHFAEYAHWKFSFGAKITFAEISPDVICALALVLAVLVGILRVVDQLSRLLSHPVQLYTVDGQVIHTLEIPKRKMSAELKPQPPHSYPGESRTHSDEDVSNATSSASPPLSCAASVAGEEQVAVVLRGHQFILDQTLQSKFVCDFPDSVLGVLLRNRNQMDTTTPFEGRDPRIFDALLKFTQTGKWKIPKGISIPLFREEADFWMVPCPSSPTGFEFEDLGSTIGWTARYGWVISEEARARQALQQELLEEHGKMLHDWAGALQDGLFVIAISQCVLKPVFEELAWRLALSGKSAVTFTFISDGKSKQWDRNSELGTQTQSRFLRLAIRPAMQTLLRPVLGPLLTTIEGVEERIVWFHFVMDAEHPSIWGPRHAYVLFWFTETLKTVTVKVCSTALTPHESVRTCTVSYLPCECSDGAIDKDGAKTSSGMGGRNETQ